MDLAESIETIEAGYEFLLAYAAQGRPAGAETGPGPHARPTLEGSSKLWFSSATHWQNEKSRSSA